MQKPDPDITCHETGHEKTCRECFANCNKWVAIRGKKPQSDIVVDEWGCADAWMPQLIIENAQQVRQLGAAIESLRNVTDKQNTAIQGMLTQLNQGLTEMPVFELQNNLRDSGYG